jgi:hypothetical protein
MPHVKKENVWFLKSNGAIDPGNGEGNNRMKDGKDFFYVYFN